MWQMNATKRAKRNESVRIDSGSDNCLWYARIRMCMDVYFKCSYFYLHFVLLQIHMVCMHVLVHVEYAMQLTHLWVYVCLYIYSNHIR